MTDTGAERVKRQLQFHLSFQGLAKEDYVNLSGDPPNVITMFSRPDNALLRHKR